jgi:hypothetical protein
LGSVADFLAQQTETAYRFLDVNGDGDLTPYDVLVVINDLNGVAAGLVDDSALAAEDPSGPLSEFVDWPAVEGMLQSEELAGLLGTLNVTASQALDWTHEVLAGIDVDQVLDPSQLGGLVDGLLARVDAWGPLANLVPANLDVQRVFELARQSADLLNALDLASVFPDLADDVDWSVAKNEVRDAVFSDLLDNEGLTGLLPLL